MTEDSPGERSLTSDCGTVTVTLGADGAPVIALDKSAERMYTRDLAELVTATAKDATRAAAEDVAAAGGPDLGDTIDMLTGFRDDLRDKDFATVMAERRAEFAEPDERGRYASPPGEAGAPKGPKLALDPAALAALDSTLDLLRRFQNTPPGTGKGEDPGPVGRARSESKLVTVESTLQFPVSEVILSKRALEIGANALGREITETAAAAIADLNAQESGYLTGIGLPFGLAEVREATEQGSAETAAGVELVAEIRAEQDRVGRMFKEGGHFA